MRLKANRLAFCSLLILVLGWGAAFAQTTQGGQTLVSLRGGGEVARQLQSQHR